MAARILDGKSLAARLRTEMKPRVDALVQRGVRPGLAVILAGDDAAARVYVRNKTLAAAEIGVHSELHEFKQDVAEAAVLEKVNFLNRDPAVHGILVQLPLPRHIDAARVLETVAPAKDVDGFHEANLGALLAGRPGVVPCTPLGCMMLIAGQRRDIAGLHAVVAGRSNIVGRPMAPLAGRHAVVIGRSNIVGKPVALLLLQKDASVTICHSKTPRIETITRQADILVAALGRAKLVGADMVKPGACVIDVGVNRLPDGKLAGDVDFDAVKEIAGWITPVPGGVGPMTIAMLLENCLRAAAREQSAS
jgi:methylenetetrahydrofolate dehydrogenase (NADP+)/methenyltetrahydrofolate cyclohydrolase